MIYNSRKEAEQALDNLQPGEIIDFCYSNGPVRSSKELFLSTHDPSSLTDRSQKVFGIMHLIDGSETYFSFDHAVDVLMDVRSAWEGTPELNEEDE